MSTSTESIKIKTAKILVLTILVLLLSLLPGSSAASSVEPCGQRFALSADGTELTSLEGCESLPTEIGLLTTLQRIILPNLKLKGSLPAEFGLLSDLRHLDLRSNGLTGELSGPVANLTRLTFLSLEDNDLKGSLPTQLGHLSALTSLDLRKNDLTGPLSEALFSLSRLEALKLARNELTGEIPEELTKLAKLTILNLSRNDLKGSIPPGLADLSALTVLNLEHNDVDGTVPSTLGLLSNLTVLDLSDNKMESSVPTELGGLLRLNVLDLNDVDLVGKIPPELGRLRKLESLRLDENKLTGEIPTELFLLTNLTVLDISDNRLESEIPTEIARLARLTYLDIDNAKVYGAIPSGIAELNQLRVLDLSGNRLSQTIPPGIGNLDELENINLGKNKLTSTVPLGLMQLRKLTHIILSDNLFEGKILPLVSNLTELEVLELQNNGFADKNVSTQLSRLQRLRKLHLGRMGLEGPFPEALTELLELAQLRLQRNKFTGRIPPEVFSRLDLNTLNVEQNQLTGSIPTEIGFAKRMKTLDLDNNILNGSIPTEMGLLSELTRLDFDFNHLTGPIPTELMELRKLKYFITDDNLMTGTIPTEVGRLRRLEFFTIDNNAHYGKVPTELGRLNRMRDFELDRNNFTGSIPSELGRMWNLRILDLDSNGLTSTLPTELFQFSRLTELFVNHNKLTGTVPRNLSGLQRIKALHLNQNNLHGDLPASLWNLTTLQSLRVDNNRRLETHVPSEIFRLDSLVFLSLGNVVCDCKLLDWFDQFINASKINNAYEAAACSSSNSFAGLYPLNARINSNAPCSHVIPSEQFNATPASVNVTFEYPYLDEIARLVEKPPVLSNTFTNIFSRDDKALEQEEIEALFMSCQNMYVLDDVEDTSVLGFEIDLTPRRRDREPVKVCHFALDIQDLSKEKGFLAVVKGLHPATEYEVVISPFYLDFRRDSYLSYIYGPSSGRTIVETASKAPPIAPPGFVAISVQARQLAVAWEINDKLIENGRIDSYQVQITEVGGNGSSILIPTTDRTLLVHLHLESHPQFLQPQSTYILKVRAITDAGGAGPFSTPINVTTCSVNTVRDLDTGECIAEVGYYIPPAAQQAVSCRTIRTVNGFNPLLDSACLERGSSVDDLPILPGFWRASTTSSSITACPREDFCLQTWRNRSAVAGTPNEYCTEYHIGVYCNDCVEGYALSRSGCSSCDESETSMKRDREIAFGLGVTAIVLFQICIFLYVLLRARVVICCRRNPRTGDSAKVRASFKAAMELREQLGISVKMRILLGFFQVLFAYQRIVQPFTQSSNAWMAFLDYISNLSLDKLFGDVSVRCIYNYNHYDILLFSTLYPIVLLVILFGMCWIVVRWKPSHRAAVWMHCSSTAYFVLFLVYPSVSQIVLSTFWCQDFPDADLSSGIEPSVLRGSFRVTCNVTDPQRMTYLAYTGVMVVVYPVGVVVLYLATLLHHREMIMKEVYSEADRSTLKSIEFLIHPYKKKKYWFEAYELIRKILQTSLIGFFQGVTFEQTSTTSFLALLEFNLCVAFLLLLLMLRPYKTKVDHNFAVFSIVLFVPMTQFSIIDPFSLETNITGIEALAALECIAFAVVVGHQILVQYRHRHNPRRTEEGPEMEPTEGGDKHFVHETASTASGQRLLPPETASKGSTVLHNSLGVEDEDESKHQTRKVAIA